MVRAYYASRSTPLTLGFDEEQREALHRELASNPLIRGFLAEQGIEIDPVVAFGLTWEKIKDINTDRVAELQARVDAVQSLL
jgi:hypothetical protein